MNCGHLARTCWLTVLCGIFAAAAHAEIVYLVPAPVPGAVPEGALIANAPGMVSASGAGYALQRSQAWRMQRSNSRPTRDNYWLVMPGTGYGAYYYQGNAALAYTQSSERASLNRSHVARANAYRMKLFER